MEINITSFFNEVAPRDLSASVAEIGRDAGAYTWQASMEASAETMLLDTPEKRDAFRAWVGEAGAWSDEEIAAWDAVQLNALFLQWIAGDMREMGIDEPGADVDWAQVERLQHEGQAPSNIFRADDGQVYFSLY